MGTRPATTAVAMVARTVRRLAPGLWFKISPPGKLVIGQSRMRWSGPYGGPLFIPHAFAIPFPCTRSARSGAARRHPETVGPPRLAGRLPRTPVPKANAATPSPGWAPPTRNFALIRRSLTKPTEAACFYCHVPQHRPATLGVLVAVAGRRWTVEEDHEFSKDQFGFDQSQTRLFTPIMRHIVLVIAALAGHYVRWSWWRRRHQARARWYHHRADSHDHGRSPAAVAGPIS